MNLNKRNLAGWVALLITVAGYVFASDAWVGQVLDVTTLPIILWAIVDWLRKEVPGFETALNSEAPFVTALALAFILPGGAYLIQAFIQHATAFSWQGFGAAFGVGMTVASTIHHGTKQVEGAQ